MNSTGFCLPNNWSIEEWPDIIAVTHEGTFEGLRVYVPERTCELEEPDSHEYMNLMICSKCGMKTAVANYCCWCGAKVVE